MTTPVTPVELSVLETLVRLSEVMVVKRNEVRDRYAVYYNKRVIATDSDLLRAAESAWVVIQAHRALLGQPPLTTLEEQREAANARAMQEAEFRRHLLALEQCQRLELERQLPNEDWYLFKKLLII